MYLVTLHHCKTEIGQNTATKSDGKGLITPIMNDQNIVSIHKHNAGYIEWCVCKCMHAVCNLHSA